MCGLLKLYVHILYLCLIQVVCNVQDVHMYGRELSYYGWCTLVQLYSSHFYTVQHRIQFTKETLVSIGVLYVWCTYYTHWYMLY